MAQPSKKLPPIEPIIYQPHSRTALEVDPEKLPTHTIIEAAIAELKKNKLDLEKEIVNLEGEID